jgi:hypothetical protein
VRPTLVVVPTVDAEDLLEVAAACGCRLLGSDRQSRASSACVPARSYADPADHHARTRRWIQVAALSLYIGPEAAAQLALVTLGLRKALCAICLPAGVIQACDESFGTA